MGTVGKAGTSTIVLCAQLLYLLTFDQFQFAFSIIGQLDHEELVDSADDHSLT